MPVTSTAWKEAVATLAMGFNTLVPNTLSMTILSLLHGVQRSILGLFGALCLSSCIAAAALCHIYHFACKGIATSLCNGLGILQMSWRHFCCRCEWMARSTQQGHVSCGMSSSNTCCCLVPVMSSGPSLAARWRWSGSALPRPLQTIEC